MVKINQLIWDEWNIAHIRKHQVIPKEVEEICLRDPLVQLGNKGRIVLVGPTKTGRILEVVLDQEEEVGVYYPVTAHTASRKDRQLYLNEKEVNQYDKKD